MCKRLFLRFLILLFLSPDGRKFRSKADLTRFFGHRLDLSNFDFKSGKMLPGYGANQKKNLNTAKSGAQKGLSGPVSQLGSVSLQRFLDPPVRQCTCIYNQKVRAIETCGTNVCKDAKDVPRTSGMKNLKPKPAQVSCKSVMNIAFPSNKHSPVISKGILVETVGRLLCAGRQRRQDRHVTPSAGLQRYFQREICRWYIHSHKVATISFCSVL